MSLHFRHAGLSDPGRVRSTNEDRWAADPALGLYLVADGLRGHAAGGLAADIVAQTLPRQVQECLSSLADASDAAVAEQLIKTILCRLSQTLVDHTEGELGLEGMGATLVVLLVRGQRGLIAHLGDSRAYLLRDGDLTCLTKDHTLLELLLDRGEIAADEALDHPARHQLTRYVGMPDAPLPDVRTIELQPRDRILLCSDGLSGPLSDAQLLELLQGTPDPAVACAQMIAAANAAGGCDNITAVLIECSPHAYTTAADKPGRCREPSGTIP